MMANEFDDEFVEELARDYLGQNFYDSETKRKLKAKAKYQMKKNPLLKELVMNTIESWEDEERDNLGGIDVHNIMNEAFPQGW